MRFVRTTVAALATAAALSSFASPAAAFTPRLEELFDHFFECKMLLLTDLDAHVRECGGGTMPTSFESLSERSDGAPPATVVTDPPTEPDCQCDGGYYDGKCYDDEPEPE